MTIEYGVAGLAAVTEEGVVAAGVVSFVDDDVVPLIAGVLRAADAVAERGRCAGLAIEYGVAGFAAVTEEVVVAVGIDGKVDDDVRHLLA